MNTMSKVRVGMIGTSQFAEMLHYAPLKSHPEAEIVAICGRNQSRAEELANKYQISEVFTDYQALIREGNVDAVVIATPDKLHYPMTMAALQAKKHVMCEKPLAMNAVQAREMFETAEQKGLIHATMFTWRWLPTVQYMAELIGQGYVGQMHNAQFNYWTQYDPNRADSISWRSDPQQSNGVIADLGSHLFDLARMIGGEIVRVASHIRSVHEHRGANGEPVQLANDEAFLLIEFEGGVQAVVQIASLAHLEKGQSQSIEIKVNGSNGMLTTVNTTQFSLIGTQGSDQTIAPLEIPNHFWYGSYPIQPDIGRFFGSMLSTAPVGERLFIDSICAHRRPTPSFYEVMKAQLVIDAAIQSNQTGCWVDVAK